MSPARGVAGPIPGPVTAAVFLIFAALGAEVAAYGPAIPHIEHRFGLGPATAGLIVTAHFLGGFVGIAAFGLSHLRWPMHRRLTVAGVVAGGGLLLAAVAPAWPLLMVATVVVGVAYGGLGVSINVLCATGYDTRSPAMLALVNAAYGTGGFVSPALVALVHGYSPVLAGAGAITLACSVGLRRAPTPSAPPVAVGSIAGRRTRRLIIGFAVLLFAEVGVESGVGTWETTHLIALGWSSGFAAGATSAYWGAFAVGRLLCAPLTLRWAPQRLIYVSLTLVTVVLVLVDAHVAPPLMYALAGLCVSPMFALVLTWLSRLTPRAGTATTYVMLGAVLGSACLPAALGSLISLAGVEYLPLGLASCSVAALGIAVLISVDTRRDQPAVGITSVAAPIVG